MASTFVSSAPTSTLSISVVNKLRKLLKIAATSRRSPESAKRELPSRRPPHRFHGMAAAPCRRSLQSVSRQDAAQLGETRLALAKDSRLPSIRHEVPTKPIYPFVEPLSGLGLPSFIFTLSKLFPINLQLAPATLRCMAFSPLYSCIDEIDGLRVPPRG
jgi:hypothetical protein